MILFWFLYLSSSFAISYLISLFFKQKILKVFSFLLIFSLSFSVWFVKPGSTDIAPVISIALAEMLFVEEHGFFRLFRPFIALLMFSIFSMSLIIFFKRKR